MLEFPLLDDRFKLIFSGATHDLILINAGQNIYHTKDEAFLEAQYFPSGDYWTVKTKDGTVHRFGSSNASRGRSLRPDLTTEYTARYMLDEVKTTSGVAVVYEYFKQSSTEYLYGHSYDQAVFPDKITYAYKDGSPIDTLREVKFNRSARSDYFDNSNEYHLAFVEKWKIDSIEVKVGTALVRKYVFEQDNSTLADNHLALKSVRMLGTDYSSSMTPNPDFRFTHDSHSMLASVTSGIGGSSSFTYEKITPVYSAPNQYWNSETGWECSSGSTKVTFDKDDFCGTTPVGVGSTPPGAGVPLYKTLQAYWDSENGWQCGTTTKATTDPNAFCGSTLITYLASTPTVMTVPLYNNYDTYWDPESGLECGTTVSVSTTPSSYCSSILIGYLYTGTADHARHRVLTRTANDGRNWTATNSYRYWDPAVGTAAYDDLPKEFRGHAKVRVTDPVGHYTETWFHQDDLRKGRAYSSETRSSAGALYNKTDSTFATTSPYAGVTFVKLDRTDNYECEGTSHCHQIAETFQYDAYGNLTQKNSLGDVLLSGDERTEITQWAVNTAKWIHRPIRTEYRGASNNLLRERWMSYDNATYGTIGDRGLLTEEESRLNGGRGHPDNPKVLHSYDAWGNKETVTDPLGCTTTTLYHVQKDVPTRVTNCLGHQTNMDYYPVTRQLLYRRDANDQYTWFNYDALGRELTVTGPLDGGSYFGTQTTGYLDWGNPNAQRVHKERTTEHGTANSLWSDERFDGLGRLYQTNQEGPDNTKAIVTSFKTFDARGLVYASAATFFVYYSGGADTALWTYFQYDPLGRSTITTFPNGTTAQKIYEHHQFTDIDPKGNIKRSFMDVYHRVTAVEEVNGSGTYSTYYDYDDANSLIKVTNHLQHKTRMVYDLLGRKIRMCDPNMGSQPSGDDCADNTQGAWKYEYDKAGNLSKQTDAKNQQICFKYDLLGRQISKREGANCGPDSGTLRIAWTYDTNTVSPPPSGGDYPVGRVTQVHQPVYYNGSFYTSEVKTQFAYDKLGRVLQTKRLLSGNWYTMSQSYDALSRVVTETFPDNDSVTYNYNSAGWLLSASSPQSPNYINDIQYNARGQKKSVTYGNNLVTTFTYNDPVDRPSGPQSEWNLRTYNRTTSGNQQNLTYGYDNNGNVTTITDTLFTAGRAYTYDALNRLSSTWFAGTNTTNYFTYDAIGNVTYRGGVTYTYGDALHPAAVTQLSVGNTYTYDANGNMTNRNGMTITWDVDNRVTSTGSVTMEYDHAGMRVKKTSGAFTTLYPFKGYEVDVASGTVSKFIMVGTEIYASKKGANKYFYHTDHLGGVNVVTDYAGTRVQLLEYNPWGGIGREEGSNVDPTHRFTGQERDPETGLYYYGGRYYDNSIGRFISADPMSNGVYDPQSLGRFTYTRNNPVNLIDPTGYNHEKKSGRIHGLGFFLGSFFSALASIIVGPSAYAWVTAETGLGLAAGSAGAYAATGAITGFASGFVNSAIQGQNPLIGGLTGAGIGATLGFLIGAAITSNSSAQGESLNQVGNSADAKLVDATDDSRIELSKKWYENRTGENLSVNKKVYLGGTTSNARILASDPSTLFLREDLLAYSVSSEIRYGTLFHEYVHYGSMNAMGIENYFAKVAYFDSLGMTGGSNPWERIAEFRGAALASEYLGRSVVPNSAYNVGNLR